MTSEVGHATSEVARWQPDVKLPEGWKIVSREVHVDAQPYYTERMVGVFRLEHGHDTFGFTQRVEVSISPFTPDLDTRLGALLEAVAAFGWRTDVYADMTGYHWL